MVRSLKKHVTQLAAQLSPRSNERRLVAFVLQETVLFKTLALRGADSRFGFCRQAVAGHCATYFAPLLKSRRCLQRSCIAK